MTPIDASRLTTPGNGPALARSDDLGRRFYTFGIPPEAFWSVTTLIGGGVPKYLHAHYAKMAAELAFDAIAEGGYSSRAAAITNRLAARGRLDVEQRQARGELKSIKLAKLSKRDLALRWIKGAADRHRDAAADRGSAVHAEAEQLVLAHARESMRLILDHETVKPWPEVIAAYQAGFTAWLDDFQPVFLAAEATVFNRTQAYAGTLDSIITLRVGDIARILDEAGRPVPAWLWEVADPTRVTVIVDLKTGNAVYPEVALQLAAYARGEFVGHPDGVTELPMVGPIIAGAVLHVTPDGYRFRLVQIDDAVYQSFLFAREVYRFVNLTGKGVLLDDLTPVKKEAA